MSLRDQLLKSGLANKDQAKKADKAAKKRLHEEMHAPGKALDSISQDIADRIQKQRQEDRERNQALEEARRQREAFHRAMDIMIGGDLRDRGAETPYYFIHKEQRISEILVTEQQQSQLAQGTMAIVSFDPDFRYFLVDAPNADKIRSCSPDFVLCWHPTPQ